MYGKRGTIYLGDLAYALRLLEVRDPATRALVAEMLGMRFEERAAAAGPQPEDEGQRPSDRARRLDEIREHVRRRARPEPTLKHEARAAIPIDVETTSGDEKDWIPDVEPLPQPGPEESAEPPPLEPLLLPHWVRGILSAALAVEVADGPLDVERIADALARRESLRALPTLPTRTMRRGLHLLVDKSEAMTPYTRDQAWLQKVIRQTAGEDRVRVFRFAGCPSWGAGEGPKPWEPYAPPPPGTPVVLLTDLGISQPRLAEDWADETEWLNFAEEVGRAHCTLLALVPFAPARWPRSLARAMTILRWDRGTNAATVGAALKRARPRQ